MHRLEDLEAAIEEALRRQEMLKAVVQVMATKAGMDWEAILYKAKKRIETAERVEAEMEEEREQKALDQLADKQKCKATPDGYHREAQLSALNPMLCTACGMSGYKGIWGRTEAEAGETPDA